jgi:hypothetical protein
MDYQGEIQISIVLKMVKLERISEVHKTFTKEILLITKPKLHQATYKAILCLEQITTLNSHKHK